MQKIFDTYVGEYEAGPNFVMRVFREGDKFMTQATGQNQIEIFPESETTFSPRTFPAKLTFVKDAEGKVTSVRLNQGGRETSVRAFFKKGQISLTRQGAKIGSERSGAEEGRGAGAEEGSQGRSEKTLTRDPRGVRLFARTYPWLPCVRGG